MSTLTPAQRKLCVKLLAQSNVNFEEQENKFVAQLRIDPAKLKTNLGTIDKNIEKNKGEAENSSKRFHEKAKEEKIEIKSSSKK